MSDFALQPVLMRRRLNGAHEAPSWPRGVRLRPFRVTDAAEAHSLLVAGYARGGGDVPPFQVWWQALSSDAEYDPALIFVAVDLSGAMIGLAQCWTRGFIKDMVVAPAWRDRGVGQALLAQAFAAFADLGLSHVDLKARAGNTGAIRLYTRLGMTVVA